MLNVGEGGIAHGAGGQFRERLLGVDRGPFREGKNWGRSPERSGGEGPSRFLRDCKDSASKLSAE